MLNLILGRTGTGKTTYLQNIISQKAAENEPVIFIVPEQFSFETERTLLDLLGPSKAGKIDVLSFTRLADAVSRVYGGFCGKKIDDAGRAVFMSIALEKVQDQLVLYNKYAGKTDMINLLLQTVAQLKNSCITPQLLAQSAAKLTGTGLKTKLSELAIIFEAYEALVAQSFSDDTDTLTKLADTLQENRFFEGKTVFLDGFKGYTQQELKIIENIVSSCTDAYIALGTDSLSDKENGLGLFSLLKRTGNRIVSIAKKHGVKVAPPVVLRENHRFKCDELAALEGSLFDPSAEAYDGASQAVTVCRAQNIYDECNYAASCIRKQLRTQGFRCREIAVIARDAQAYRTVLQEAFDKYQIPYYKDNRQPIHTQPLLLLVRYLFAFLTENSSDAIFHYLKTGIAGFSVEEISLLENYAFIWGLQGGAWQKPWYQHPKGFGHTFTNDDEKLLEQLNGLRERVITPLLKTKQAMKDKSGREITQCLYAFLEENGIAQNLKAFALELKEDGQTQLAYEQGQIWDKFMGILDQLYLTLDKTYLSLSRYADLLNLVVSLQDIGTIPQGLDEVTVGSADRIRVTGIRSVYILGANESIFPGTPVLSGLFSEADRQAMKDIGIEFFQDAQEQSVEERYIAYTALCAASETLTVTYSGADISSKALSPSVIIHQLRSILPNAKFINTADIDKLHWVETKQAGFEALAANWKEASPLSESLFHYFSSDDEFSSKFSALRRMTDGGKYAIEDRETAKRLFGENMFISASRIESYYRCAFAYFCRYGLGIQAPKPAALDALQTGTVIHFLLEKLVSEHSTELASLPSEVIEKETEAHLEEYLQTCMGGGADKTARFTYLFQRIAKTVCELMEVMKKELEQSSFVPTDFELSIDRDGDVQPCVLPLPDGGSVSVRGKIDRVDVMKANDISYIRIIDYKSGTKKFRLSDIFAGLNMQMLLYLFTLEKNGQKRYGNIIPSGILYLPAKRPEPSLPRGADKETVEAEKIKALKMNGMVLQDLLVIHSMEKDGEGIFIPAKVNAQGGITGTCITLSQLGKLSKKIEGLVTQMAMSLHDGDVQALPAVSPSLNSCDWCEYKCACGHEQGSEVRHVVEFKHSDALKRLEEETENV